MLIKVRGDVQAFFAASTYVEVGDGTSTLFWLDRWIGGRAVAALADGLFGRRWVRDIAGGLSVQAIVECIRLWDALESVRLSALPDTIVCRWAADGQYSARSAYEMLLVGSQEFLGHKLIWEAWAPLRVKLFI